jgi:histidinol-phosphate phosphatase family protein
VLLDRDGTIIEEKHYLSDPAQVELIPGAAEGLRKLRSLGLGLAIVTNQSGIGRGYFDLARLDAIHRRLLAQLGAAGVELDGIFFCPHTPDDACECRKPATGLAERAARELRFDPREAFVIGDLPSDVALGRALGSTTLLVRTGHGSRTESRGQAKPDYVVEGLGEAAELIGELL